MNAYDVSNINVASLNIGINQEMLYYWQKWSKHGKKLGQLVDRFFNADNNDVVFLSEFGDYRQGLEYSGVNLQALFEHAVGAGVQYAACGAFCTIYNGLPAGGASQSARSSDCVASQHAEVGLLVGTCTSTGKSFGCNAIRRDNHDTVSAMLMVPCRGGTQPAEPAEPQRAEKPSSSQSMQQPAQPAEPQRAEKPSSSQSMQQPAEPAEPQRAEKPSS